MPRHFSTFNFKPFRNAGFLALVLILMIEGLREKPLSAKHQSHEVDRLIRSLNTKNFSAPVLLMGDSVAGNVFKAFHGQSERFDVFSSNQAIEATGQYFILRRYLEQNPAPEVIAYMAGLPFYGDLDQIYTENFVQRVFTNWREIGWMSAHKLDPAFLLKSLAYKFSPTFRFRLQLQTEILGEPQTDIYAGTGFTSATVSPAPQYSLSRLLAESWQKIRGQTASERSWQRILDLCAAHRIAFHFFPTPTQPTDGGIRQTRKTLQAVQQRSENLNFIHIREDYAMTLPANHFRDGSHLNDKGQDALQPYRQKMENALLREAYLKILEELPDGQETLYTLYIWDQLGLLLPYNLQGFYDLEGNRVHSFRWTKPSFRIDLPAGERPRTLRLTTAPVSPSTSVQIDIAGISGQTLSLEAGEQFFDLNLPPGKQPLRLDFQVRGWHPGNKDPRELGIALSSIQKIKAQP